MKTYLFYKKGIVLLSDEAKNTIKESAVSCFKLKKFINVSISYYESEKILVDGREYEYYFVIDDYNPNDIVLQKKSFEPKLLDIINRNANKQCVGLVKVQSGFDPNSFCIKDSNQQESTSDEYDYRKRSKTYVPEEPSYSFDRVILPDGVIQKIEESINILVHEKKVFDEWGLRAIQPNPSSALSFFGPSGTGKTMAAEAVAHKLGKKILKVSYADIESKYHGEGPKMVKAIFLAAENNDAVLFIDEADSLLSKRLTNVTQGSEQAINSMRSQLLICLEQFHGIVIFATNLVVNYDKAFLTRLISIEFKMPDEEQRKKIWDVHLYPVNGNGLNIPLASDVDTLELSKKFAFSGREIRKAVISACVKVSMENRDKVSQKDLILSSETIIAEEEALKNQK